MLAQTSAVAAAASRMTALPASFSKKERTGAATRRAQAVVPANRPVPSVAATPTRIRMLAPVTPERYSRVAVTAALNGVAGLIIVPFACSLAAILFGLWGRRRVEKKPELKGRGLATAGIWLGVLGLIVAAAATIASGGWNWTSVS